MRARRERLKQGASLVYRVMIAAFLIVQAHGQLAITEVMSSAAGDPLIANDRMSDYWELTNFGTNRIDLSGYFFNDADHQLNQRQGLVPVGSPVSFVEPFQSIVFVRNDVVKSEAQFLAWWGSSISSNTVISFYEEPGFTRFGDALTLYSGTEIVDSVRFGTAKGGASFVYDTATGEFGFHSVAGKDGAVRAETTADVGSPGTTAGPVPLRILSQPESVEIYPLLTTNLNVKAAGLPRAQYQWFFNGTMMPNATKATLALSNVTASMEGTYYVEVFNGLTNLVSSNAVVTLNSKPLPPQIVSTLQNATVLANKSARFTLIVAALPVARYQWFLNNVLLPNETGRSLLIQNCPLEMSGAEVRVRAENSLGWVEASARLYVTTKLDLRITEIHADPNNGCEDHHDWFELTNFGNSDLQLLGYRFLDQTALREAVIITESFVLAPGESMICVNDSAVGSFVEWWGVENLPPGLKIFSYSGFSLRARGEPLFLWSDSAETDDELVDGVVLSESRTGTSQWIDENGSGQHSEVGLRGAFRAIECGDIGSPGYIANRSLRFVSVERNASGTALKWHARIGARYEVASSHSLGHPWTPISIVTATNSLAEIIDGGSINANARFYQIREIDP